MSGTLRDALAGHLARQPDRTFLVAPETGRRLSYQKLEYQARLLARWLRAAGLKPGDKVGLYLHNGYQTALLYLGAMLGGYVIAPLNLLSQRSQLAYVIAHCDCRILFTAREYEEPLGAALAVSVAGALLGGGVLWTVGFVHARLAVALGRRFEHWPGAGEALPRPASFDYWTWFPGLGFGDVKLLAMIGAVLGPFGVLEALVAAAFAGLAVGLAFALAARRFDAPFGFAPALAAGGLLVAFVSA